MVLPQQRFFVLAPILGHEARAQEVGGVAGREAVPRGLPVDHGQGMAAFRRAEQHVVEPVVAVGDRLHALRRVHPWLPWLVGVIGLVFVHIYGSYMVKGTGEASARLLGLLPAWAWSVFWVCVAAVFLYRGAYRHVEIIFYVFLIMLSVSLLGVAVWAFFWAVGSGQFDDLETPAVRVIMDDDEKPPESPET